jgi:hypothetical protein
LHVSAGGAQALTAQPGMQVRVPAVPQLVVQSTALPSQHGKPSSHMPSQSSSAPLQISSGGVHAPQAQAPWQVWAPVLLHDVVHGSVAPRQQANPSSHAPSQSSSMPLHSSVDGAWMQAPAGSVQTSLVAGQPSSQSTRIPPTHVCDGPQVSAPLQARPSEQSPSTVHGRTRQPAVASQISPTAQSELSGV